ncbi:hypothetical protein BGX31_010176 [Mortierella sp. GBA43]|nr:hypothetical protein BGX31_010176 [Mortierella sp. GBA43]
MSLPRSASRVPLLMTKQQQQMHANDEVRTRGHHYHHFDIIRRNPNTPIPPPVFSLTLSSDEGDDDEDDDEDEDEDEEEEEEEDEFDEDDDEEEEEEKEEEEEEEEDVDDQHTQHNEDVSQYQDHPEEEDEGGEEHEDGKEGEEPIEYPGSGTKLSGQGLLTAQSRLGSRQEEAHINGTSGNGYEESSVDSKTLIASSSVLDWSSYRQTPPTTKFSSLSRFGAMVSVINSTRPRDSIGDGHYDGEEEEDGHPADKQVVQTYNHVVDPFQSISELREGSIDRLAQAWLDICIRYGRDVEDLPPDDEIDLATGEVIVDNGFLKSRPHTPFGTLTWLSAGPRESTPTPSTNTQDPKKRKRSDYPEARSHDLDNDGDEDMESDRDHQQSIVIGPRSSRIQESRDDDDDIGASRKRVCYGSDTNIDDLAPNRRHPDTRSVSPITDKRYEMPYSYREPKDRQCMLGRSETEGGQGSNGEVAIVFDLTPYDPQPEFDVHYSQDDPRPRVVVDSTSDNESDEGKENQRPREIGAAESHRENDHLYALSSHEEDKENDHLYALSSHEEDKENYHLYALSSHEEDKENEHSEAFSDNEDGYRHFREGEDKENEQPDAVSDNEDEYHHSQEEDDKENVQPNTWEEARSDLIEEEEDDKENVYPVPSDKLPLSASLNTLQQHLQVQIVDVIPAPESDGQANTRYPGQDRDGESEDEDKKYLSYLEAWNNNDPIHSSAGMGKIHRSADQAIELRINDLDKAHKENGHKPAWFSPSWKKLKPPEAYLTETSSDEDPGQAGSDHEDAEEDEPEPRFNPYPTTTQPSRTTSKIFASEAPPARPSRPRIHQQRMPPKAKALLETLMAKREVCPHIVPSSPNPSTTSVVSSLSPQPSSPKRKQGDVAFNLSPNGADELEDFEDYFV